MSKIGVQLEERRQSVAVGARNQVEGPAEQRGRGIVAGVRHDDILHGGEVPAAVVADLVGDGLALICPDRRITDSEAQTSWTPMPPSPAWAMYAMCC